MHTLGQEYRRDSQRYRRLPVLHILFYSIQRAKALVAGWLAAMLGRERVSEIATDVHGLTSTVTHCGHSIFSSVGIPSWTMVGSLHVTLSVSVSLMVD